MSSSPSLVCPQPVVSESGPASAAPAIRRQIPSQRNRDIFEAVTQGKSHAVAAEKFSVTQPRVTQIVAQVREWIYQTSPEVREGASECGMLRLAEYTLRIQLDGWMRVAMGNYHNTLKTTFMSQACQMAMNLARLSGVDTSGKTARAKAEVQAREEAAKRAEAAEKPLWENREKSVALLPNSEAHAAATPSREGTCVGPAEPRSSPCQAAESEKNPYGLAMPTSEDGPLPRFLDKKSRKRMRAMRRREARTLSLATAGS